MKKTGRRPAHREDLATMLTLQIAAILADAGVDVRQAQQLGRSITYGLSARFGGAQYYFPRDGVGNARGGDGRIAESSSRLLAAVPEVAREELQAHGHLRRAAIAAVAKRLRDDFSRAFSGHVFYFPMWKVVDRALRNDQIAKEFNGRNHADLARRFGLSVQTIYKILARKRSQTRLCPPVRRRTPCGEHATPA